MIPVSYLSKIPIWTKSILFLSAYSSFSSSVTISFFSSLSKTFSYLLLNSTYIGFIVYILFLLLQNMILLFQKNFYLKHHKILYLYSLKNSLLIFDKFLDQKNPKYLSKKYYFLILLLSYNILILSHRAMS